MTVPRTAKTSRRTERARKKPIDDDIKCAVALRRATRELRDYVILQTFVIANKFHVMNEIITTWMFPRRMFPASSSRSQAPKDQNAMEIGAVFGKGKNGKGESKGKDGKAKGKGKYSYVWHGKGYGQKGKDSYSTAGQTKAASSRRV